MAGFAGVDTIMLVSKVNGKDFWTEYKRNEYGSWDKSFKTSSIASFCKAEGVFRECKTCRDFQKTCRKRQVRVSDKELGNILEGVSIEKHRNRMIANV